MKELEKVITFQNLILVLAKFTFKLSFSLNNYFGFGFFIYNLLLLCLCLDEHVLFQLGKNLIFGFSIIEKLLGTIFEQLLLRWIQLWLVIDICLFICNFHVFLILDGDLLVQFISCLIVLIYSCFVPFEVSCFFRFFCYFSFHFFQN